MADEHEPLGALTGEERSAIASQFSLLAKASTALAKLFDPSVKAKMGRPPKEKVGKSSEPKAKREPTAYNNFMAAHLKPYKAEVRHVARRSRAAARRRRRASAGELLPSPSLNLRGECFAGQRRLARARSRPPPRCSTRS